MIRGMKMRMATWVCASCAVALVACGGENKGADSPGTCPEGTVLKGADCVAPETPSAGSGSKTTGGGSSDTSASSADTDKPAKTDADKPPAPSPGASAPQAPSDGKAAYDKDAVEEQLKRAERQIKSNCGSGTDENGKAAGPWGAATATVTLGRNGRVQQVNVSAPYDGKPVGQCVQHAYQKIVFPPYAASGDSTITRDVEVVQPKKK